MDVEQYIAMRNPLDQFMEVAPAKLRRDRITLDEFLAELGRLEQPFVENASLYTPDIEQVRSFYAQHKPGQADWACSFFQKAGSIAKEYGLAPHYGVITYLAEGCCGDEGKEKVAHHYPFIIEGLSIHGSSLGKQKVLDFLDDMTLIS